MRQRIRMHAIRVIVLLFAVFTASCDQATQLTAPSDVDVQYKLNGNRVSRLLAVVSGSETPATANVLPRGANVTELALPAADGEWHYLFVEGKAVRHETVFSMGVSATPVTGPDGQEIYSIELSATTVGSNNSNDAGSRGFRRGSVVLCLYSPEATDAAQIYWVAGSGNFVQMKKTINTDEINHICAELPHFSGFVMGAN